MRAADDAIDNPSPQYCFRKKYHLKCSSQKINLPLHISPNISTFLLHFTFFSLIAHCAIYKDGVENNSTPDFEISTWSNDDLIPTNCISQPNLRCRFYG